MKEITLHSFLIFSGEIED